MLRRINRWVGFSCVRVLGVFAWLHWCISSTCIGSTGDSSPATPRVYFYLFNRRVEISHCRFFRCSAGFVLLPLWTTAPTLEFDFVGSSGVASTVELTLFKPMRRINRWLLFSCCQLCLTGLTDAFKFIFVGSTGELYRAFSNAVSACLLPRFVVFDPRVVLC